MNISNINNSKYITFKARNKNIRKADDIQRKARQTFPMLSPTYIERFYLSAKTNKAETPVNTAGYDLFLKADEKLSLLRDMTNNPEKYNIVPFENPNVERLRNLKVLKVGNCKEASIAALAALAANGYYDSQRYLLCLESKFINKKTNKREWNVISSIDHTFIVTTLGKENPEERDKIVIDPWLGFTDSISGAVARYKSIYKQDELNNEISYHRSFSKIKIAETTGKIINYNDYRINTNFVIMPARNYSEDELQYIGSFSRVMYPDILLNNNPI